MSYSRIAYPGRHPLMLSRWRSPSTRAYPALPFSFTTHASAECPTLHLDTSTAASETNN